MSQSDRQGFLTAGIFIAVLLVMLAFAAFMSDTPLESEGEKVEVECPPGYENCIGTPISKEKVIKDLDWCNVAWSGIPDQHKEPDDDRERVLNWLPNQSPYGSARYIYWDAWETEKQREIRVALDGWITCENRPR